MVLKWINDNILDTPTKRANTPTVPVLKAGPKPKLKTQLFSKSAQCDSDLPIVGESHCQPTLERAREGVKDYAGKGLY